MDAQSSPFNDVEPARGGTQLTGAERAEHDATTQQALLDLAPLGAGPAVAGLFAHGREFCARPDTPSSGFFIGHAGREVTRGIVELLLGPTVKKSARRSAGPLKSSKTQATPADNHGAQEVSSSEFGSETEEQSETGEEFRNVLGNVLGVGRDDPIVKRWFDLHKRFVAAAHFRAPPPVPQTLRDLFGEFSEFLYGLVGPFYDTQAELDALADLREPSDTDVERLTHRLLRRAQRQRFFARANPRWLLPLSRAGFFRRPPERQVEADGSWRVSPWPEGEFIVRVAPTSPSAVSRILTEVPRTLENPAVWNVVAKSANVLPAEDAAKLTDMLVHALKTAPPVLFPHTLVDVVSRLADGRQHEAFRIAEALLWVAKTPDAPTRKDDEDEDVYLSRVQEESNTLLMRSDWLLARSQPYDFTRFVEIAVPALLRFDTEATLRLFVGVVTRLDRVIQHVEARLFASDNEPRIEGRSRRWSSDLLYGGDGHDDLLEEIATVVSSAAVSLAQASADDAAETLAILGSGQAELLDRVRLLVIASAGSQVQEALDKVVSDPMLLSPAYGAAEVAHLLRTQFANSSQSARAAFAAQLQKGPALESVLATLQFWERPETDEEKAREVAHWQARRLRWFHEHIPSELAELATRLGVIGEVPDREQQALDEVGSWSSGVYSKTERSPILAENLLVLSAPEAFELLRVWQPAQGLTQEEDPPSRAGLVSAVQIAAAASPQTMLTWARFLNFSDLAPDFIHAVLAGLHQAIREKRPVELEAILAFVNAAFRAAKETASDENADAQRVRWACNEAVRVLDFVARWDHLSADEVGQIVRLITDLSDETITRFDAADENELDTLERAIHAGWSTLAGRLMEAAVVLAIAQSQRFYRNTPIPVDFPPVLNLTQLTDRLLSLNHHAGVGARSALGDRLASVFWLAPVWADAHVPRELDSFFISPARYPAFASFLAHSHTNSETFRRLRAWYTRLADDGTLRRTSVGDKSTLGRLLVTHVVLAMVSGLRNTRDVDRLVERTFTGAPVEDLGHAYWAIFRGWSDADSSVTTTKVWLTEAAPRLLQLWEWRLFQIENVDTLVVVDRADEADHLLWFLATPHLPVTETISLGRRTIDLLDAKSRTAGIVWERLCEISQLDPAGAFDLSERLVMRFLDSDFIYLPFEHIAPIFRAAMKQRGNLMNRAKRLINLLGERGHGEFEPLYRELEAASIKADDGH